MSSDRWPAVRVERFMDEPIDQYVKRRDEIVTIITGFRRGRYTGDTAERMEQRLVALQDGLALVAA